MEATEFLNKLLINTNQKINEMPKLRFEIEYNANMLMIYGKMV